jgi:hypothetical protein
MKLFTLEEANAILPGIVPELIRIRELYTKLALMRDRARAAAAASHFGGGMEGGTRYVNTLYNVGRITTELNRRGIELKDYERGLIDFPSMRNDRVVMLCWQLGEDPEIRWWHEPEAGFAGRQPI